MVNTVIMLVGPLCPVLTSLEKQVACQVAHIYTTPYSRQYRMEGCVAHVTGRAAEVTLGRNTTWLE